MTKAKHGFSYIVIIIVVVILIILFFLAGALRHGRPTSLTEGPDKKFTAYNLGVNFDDFEFTDADLSHHNNKILLENGHQFEFQGKTHTFPHVSYILPPGTEMLAVTDGVVRNIKYQKETEDYSLVVDAKDSNWTIDYDHVGNVKVEKGEEIKANQVIAETVKSNGQLGRDNLSFTEIMIFHDRGPFGNIPTVCLYALIDEPLKEELYNQIFDLTARWEEYKGDETIHDESSWQTPGCIVDEMIDPES